MKKSKVRTSVWLHPETMERLDGWLSEDNCKSRSEFIEKALQFYMGYLASEDTSMYLSKALMSGLQGTLEVTENRVSGNLFRLSVEVSMMMHCWRQIWILQRMSFSGFGDAVYLM